MLSEEELLLQAAPEEMNKHKLLFRECHEWAGQAQIAIATLRELEGLR
jgi:hypothetical protein